MCLVGSAVAAMAGHRLSISLASSTSDCLVRGVKFLQICGWTVQGLVTSAVEGMVRAVAGLFPEPGEALDDDDDVRLPLGNKAG